MKNFKKSLFVFATTGALLFGATTNTFAVTPQYHSWVPKIPEITWDSLSDESKDIINDVVNDAVGDIDFDINALSIPTIREATYHHGKFFYDRTRLQIRWDEVIDADHYEVRVVKSDGTSRIYETFNTSLFVYCGSDNFITECVRSGKVEVRACNGDMLSKWSSKKTISCNSFHR